MVCKIWHAQKSMMNRRMDKQSQSFSKLGGIIRSSTCHYQSIHKVSRLQIVFEIFYCQDFIHIFSKGHYSEKGHNPDEKKKYVSPIFS